MKKFGRIETLADIKGRSIEVGDCWEWQGSFAGCGIPKHTINGKQQRAHNTAFKLAGKKQPPGTFLVRSCGNGDCVNPAHVEAMTRKEQMRLVADLGRCSRPDQIAARTRAARENSKYSMEQARSIRQMRQCGLRCTEIAVKLNIPVDIVSKISLGRLWAETTQAASVFNWRPEHEAA